MDRLAVVLPLVLLVFCSAAVTSVRSTTNGYNYIASEQPAGSALGSCNIGDIGTSTILFYGSTSPGYIANIMGHELTFHPVNFTTLSTTNVTMLTALVGVSSRGGVECHLFLLGRNVSEFTIPVRAVNMSQAELQRDGLTMTVHFADPATGLSNYTVYINNDLVDARETTINGSKLMISPSALKAYIFTVDTLHIHVHLVDDAQNTTVNMSGNDYFVVDKLKTTVNITVGITRPVCSTIPSSPSCVSNMATVDVKGVTYLLKATYSGNTGYRTVGQNVLLCVGNNIFLPPIPPKCEPVPCNKPLNLPCTNAAYHSDSVTKEFNYVSNLDLVCHNSSYETVSIGQLFCQANGMPATPTCPACKASPCDVNNIRDQLRRHNTTLLQNGQIYTGRTVEVNTAHLALGCSRGYNLSTPKSNIKCRFGPTWDVPSTTCSPVKCSAPPLLSNASLMSSDTDYTYLDTVMYECDQNFRRATGDTTLRCGEHGQWTGQHLDCKPAPCNTIHLANILGGQLQLASHYSSSGTEVDVGQMARLQCKKGYRLTGNGTVQCLFGGGWYTITSMCDIINCGPPAAVNGALFHAGNYTYMGMVNVSCAEKHLVPKTSSLICDASGSWRGDATCVKSGSAQVAQSVVYVVLIVCSALASVML